MKPSSLQIGILHLDAGTQSRAAIDQDLVTEYGELMLADVEFPPIEVTCDGESFYVTDGFHRVHAAKNVGRKSILAHVIKGTLADAIWASLGANRANGKRPTRADREKAIKTALEKFPQRSSRVIATHIGVDHKTVEKYRRETDSNWGIPQLETRQGADGRNRTPAPRRDADTVSQPRSTGEFPSCQTQSPPAGTATTVPSGGQLPTCPDAPADEPQPVRPQPRTDCLGSPVEGHVAEAFARVGEIDELLGKVSELKSAVTKAVDANDPLYADIVLSQFQADCGNLHRALRAAKPYAVCPYCKASGCRACRNRGWVGHLVYKAAPEDLRAQ